MADTPDTEAPVSDFEAYSPEPPEEQQDAETLEKSRANASLPVLQEVLDWFDEQVAEFKDPMIIDGVNVSSDPQQVKDAVLFAQGMISRFEKKKGEFTNRFSDYL